MNSTCSEAPHVFFSTFPLFPCPYVRAERSPVWKAIRIHQEKTVCSGQWI